MDIEVCNLTKSFEERLVLDNFNATFPEGNITCIMGDSGCGKTTLLNILLGFMKPDSGTISGLPDRIGVVFQEDRLCEEFNAVSNIRLVTGGRVSDDEILDLLRKLGLNVDPNQPVSEFSGGMKRRVAIARALMFDCDLMIFDEAFKGLDEDTKKNVLDCAREYSVGRTVLSVTHDPSEAELFGDYLIRMEGK